MRTPMRAHAGSYARLVVPPTLDPMTCERVLALRARVARACSVPVTSAHAAYGPFVSPLLSVLANQVLPSPSPLLGGAGRSQTGPRPRRGCAYLTEPADPVQGLVCYTGPWALQMSLLSSGPMGPLAKGPLGPRARVGPWAHWPKGP